MLIGWVEIIRAPFFKRPTDFVSVDARRFSNNPKNYEMITSLPPGTADSMIKAPEPVVTSPAAKADGEGLSPLVQSPLSPSSQHTNSVDYCGKDFADYKNATFGKEAEYRSPKLSFSTPRPPSAGGPLTSHSRSSFSSPIGPFSLQRRDSSTHNFTNSHRERESANRPFSPAYEWDPAATHAKPSRQQDPYRL